FNYVDTTHVVDWSNGTATNPGYRKKESQSVNSVVISYVYTPLRRDFAPLLLAGFSLSFRTSNYLPAPKQPYGLFSANLKMGLGFSYKPGYYFDLRVYPVLYYNLNSTKSTQINTRFYTAGLEIGIFTNIDWLKNYTPH
ncbi:MAG: hypothetical protein JNL60_17040, partial [Bacteroidia bacterium]|nr:hypothetical protein [Bacteroidia bacterium]